MLVTGMPNPQYVPPLTEHLQLLF